MRMSCLALPCDIQTRQGPLQEAATRSRVMSFLRHFYFGEHVLFSFSLRKTGVCATVKKLRIVSSPFSREWQCGAVKSR